MRSLLIQLIVFSAIFFKGSISFSNEETYKQLQLFGDVFEIIGKEFVTEVDNVDALESAINGMLSSLDPYSGYMNIDKYEKMQIETEGQFGGLGIEVTMDEGFIKVIAPIEGTPASEAGIKAGDFITHLDGEQILGKTLQEAVELMRGPVNTKITLSIARKNQNDEPEYFDIDIVRKSIVVDSVQYAIIDNVGYIKIVTFNEQAEKGMLRAIKKIRSGIGNEKNKGFIIDLRNNPGGLLSQAIGVSDSFLEGGEIVSTRGRNNDISRFNARKGDITYDKPIIILINEGSASASEIVAGALQDHKRAIILGKKSYGKGSVQSIIPLGKDGALRLTTAHYFTPSGKLIKDIGITPDIEIEQKNDDRITFIKTDGEVIEEIKNDSQLSYAINLLANLPTV